MAIKLGKINVDLKQILNSTTEFSILYHYFDIDEIPCIISSPLRVDNSPSFGIYTLDGHKIHWTDLSTREGGGIFDLLIKYWGVSYSDTLARVWEDLPNIKLVGNSHNSLGIPNIVTTKEYSSTTDLKCKIRDWKQYDLKYWEQYGINSKWLKYADIYPISHKIVIKNGHKMIFLADKYAYAYVESKEGIITLKIYQPFNKLGYKWANRHDRSVISLWTKLPPEGDNVCICASMKDALCLWANTGIPSVAIQGEGYNMSNTAISELKRRFKNVYILFDNDEAGLIDGVKLSNLTGFTNIVLPKFKGGKDTSDLMKIKGKDVFLKTILPLFNINNNDLERNKRFP